MKKKQSEYPYNYFKIEFLVKILPIKKNNLKLYVFISEFAQHVIDKTKSVEFVLYQLCTYLPENCKEGIPLNSIYESRITLIKPVNQ